MKKLIAGNWKSNGTLASADALIKGVSAAIATAPDLLKKCDFVVCPPFVHLPLVASGRGPNVALGAQDCAATGEGAHTGDVTGGMLIDLGCTHVILGHSERRQGHNESDREVSEKAAAAHKAGLVAIICVGETEEQREQGIQNRVVGTRLGSSLPSTATAENTVIAYEPIWAIGTGKTATADDIADMHAFIRETLGKKLADGAKLRILYGGSVKPGNAREIFATPNVDGALIGGASLKTEDYIGIAQGA